MDQITDIPHSPGSTNSRLRAVSFENASGTQSQQIGIIRLLHGRHDVQWSAGNNELTKLVAQLVEPKGHMRKIAEKCRL